MNPNESRNNQQYNLYTNERKFLLWNDTGAENAGEIRTRIQQERLPNLTTRIQHLINDVALLDNRGFLTSDTWESGWPQLQDLEYPQELRECSVWLPRQELAGSKGVGFTLGCFARALSKDLVPKYQPGYLGWGFLLGAVGRPQGQYKQEFNQISSIINTLNSQFEYRKEAVRSQPVETESRRIEADAAHSSAKHQQPGKSAIAEFQEKAIKDRQVRKESSEPIDSGILDFLEEVFEAPPEEITAATNLTEDIREGLHKLENTHWRNAPAREPFQTLYTGDKALTSGKIASRCGVKRRLVSYLLDALAGNKGTNIWERAPLVKDDSTDGRGREWKLTDHGKLIGACVTGEAEREKIHRTLADILTEGSPEQEYQDLINQLLESYKAGKY